MAAIKSLLIEGLKVVAPFLITLFLFYWLFVAVENFLRWLLLLFIDQSYYFTGLGWIVIVMLILFSGLVMKIRTVQKMKKKAQSYILKLPLINTFYDTATDLISLFTGQKMEKAKKAVLLKTAIGNIIGIVTQDQLKRLPNGIGGEDDIAVYVQMSYNVGGYTFIVPRDSVEPLNISVREAMTLTMTGLISGKKDRNED